MLYLDVHAIQNVPPSNINRDDTGSPKTALYGGVRRARVSSQAWKHAMRDLFTKLLPEGSLGVRTKLAQGMIANRIVELKPELADQAQGGTARGQQSRQAGNRLNDEIHQVDKQNHAARRQAAARQR